MNRWQRITASIGIVLLCTLLVLGMLLAVARSARVQTAAVSVVAEQLSRGLGARVEVGRLDYKFPNRLHIRQVLLEDRQGDTLLFVDTLSARMDFLKLLREDTLCVCEVGLHGALINIYRVETPLGDSAISRMNYQFLIDAFKSDSVKEKKPMAVNLQVKQIDLTNIRFRYCDWTGRVPGIALHLHNFNPDCLDAEIEHLTCHAKRNGLPLDIEDVEARVLLTDSLITFPKLHLRMPESDLRIEELTIDQADAKRIADAQAEDSAARAALLAKTAIALRMDHTTLTPYDLRAVVPTFKTLRAPWTLSAAMSGRVDSLELTDMRLAYRRQEILSGNATVLGLPEFDSIYVRVRCTDLTTNKAMLQDIISGFTGKATVLPDMVSRLGQMHYKGLLNGHMKHLQLCGAFTTALGSIHTDGTASLTEDMQDIHFDGSLATTRFQLGNLLGVSDLGTVSMNVKMNGERVDSAFTGNASATLLSLEYKGYAYRNLQLDGDFRHNVFSGTLRSLDPNIQFVFRGKADFNKSDPAFDFTFALHHLRLGALHLSDKYADSEGRFGLRVKMQGTTLDEMHGMIELDTLFFSHLKDTLLLPKLTLTAEQHYGRQLDGRDLPSRSVKLNSRYLNGGISGDYSYTSLQQSALAAIARYLPHLFSDKERKRLESVQCHNHLNFYLYGSDLNRISEVLDLNISVGDRPTLKGSISDEDRRISVQGLIPDLLIGSNQLENITLDFNNHNQRLNFALKARNYASEKEQSLSAQMGDMDMLLSAHAAHDSVRLTFNWANPQETHQLGNINVNTHFARYADKPLITAHILPSDFVLADSLWHLSDSRIVYSAADTVVHIDHFRLGSTTQFIAANGVASTHMSDSIHIALQDINLNYFLSALTNLEKTIWFGGNVTGWATAYGILRAPMFEASVKMLHAQINGSEIGDVYAGATLDRKTGNVLIAGDCFDPLLPWEPAAIDSLPCRRVFEGDHLPINFFQTLPDSIRHSGRHVVHVDGQVGGPNGRWGLRIYPDSVRIGFVQWWCQGILQNLNGRGSGHLFVGGKTINGEPITTVLLAAKPHNAGITLPWTGARYYVNDTIRMDQTGIRFRNMHLHDAEGHVIDLDGDLDHNGNFQDFKIRFDVDAHKALIVDLPDNGADFYGGHVYGNGHVSVSGTEKQIRVDARATTTGGNFFVDVSTASNARENSFIEFVDRSKRIETPTKRRKHLSEMAKTVGPSTKLLLSLQVDVTPQATVSVLLDRHTGDRLTGKGEGSVRLTLNNDNISMLGDYTLQQGNFGFTFQNVIRRQFQIAEGSSVTWSGTPENPDVKVKAIYHVTASLRDLFGEDASQVTNRGSVPVNCVLNLSDKLTNPVISFGIELPSSDESVASQVRAVINTDEMLMRQVLYLLVFGRFYTPEYLQNTANVGLNETYSLISSTVTGQINSWLSKITDMVTLGFNFRTDGEGANSSQEYEAQFEIRPVRGLILNGNLGYRYNDISNQPIFGNLDVEYMLTSDGKLRAKAYTHTVDKYSLRQANTVQGVGLVVKHDFNWPTKESIAQDKILRAQRKAERAAEKEKKAAAKAKKAEEKAQKAAAKAKQQKAKKTATTDEQQKN